MMLCHLRCLREQPLTGGLFSQLLPVHLVFLILLLLPVSASLEHVLGPQSMSKRLNELTCKA